MASNCENIRERITNITGLFQLKNVNSLEQPNCKQIAPQRYETATSCLIYHVLELDSGFYNVLTEQMLSKKLPFLLLIYRITVEVTKNKTHILQNIEVVTYSVITSKVDKGRIIS